MRVWLAGFAAGLTLVPAAGGAAPPFGALIPIGGSKGCVERGDGSDGCAMGRGLNQVHSVAISPDGRFLYSGAGSIADPPDDDGAIGIFAVDRTSGGIAQLPGKQGCLKNPAAASGTEGCAIARNTEGMRFVNLSPDGRFLYTGSYFGVSVFRRDPETGALRQLPGRAGCFRSDGKEGCTQAFAIKKTEDVRFSRDGRFVYTANNGFDSLVIFRRDPRSGQLTQLPHAQGCIAIGTGGCTPGRAVESPRGVTLSPDERFLYLATLSDSVAVFRRNPVTGTLAQLPGQAGCITAEPQGDCAVGRGLYSPHRVTITRDGRFAYVAGKRGSRRGSAISVWNRDPRTGVLHQLPGRDGCISEFDPDVPPTPQDTADDCATGRVIQGAHIAVLDREERTVYVASDRTQGGMAIFRRDPTSGALRQLAGRWGCIAPSADAGCTAARRHKGLHYVVLSPDERFAYAAGEDAEAVVAYRRIG